MAKSKFIQCHICGNSEFVLFKSGFTGKYYLECSYGHELIRLSPECDKCGKDVLNNLKEHKIIIKMLMGKDCQ